MASTLRFDNWEDSNGTPILDGSNLAIPSSALPTGSILQVVSEQATADFTTTSPTAVDITGFTATITPTSATSTILILLTMEHRASSSSTRNVFNLYKDGGNLVEFSSQNVGNYDHYLALNFKNSPATTSAVTYKVVVRVQNGGTFTGKPRSITLMEVAG